MVDEVTSLADTTTLLLLAVFGVDLGVPVDRRGHEIQAHDRAQQHSGDANASRIEDPSRLAG